MIEFLSKELKKIIDTMQLILSDKSCDVTSQTIFSDMLVEYDKYYWFLHSHIL